MCVIHCSKLFQNRICYVLIEKKGIDTGLNKIIFSYFFSFINIYILFVTYYNVLLDQTCLLVYKDNDIAGI